MTYEDILGLVRQGESETLEFKKSTAQLKNAAESLCGFLNHNGGIVLMGVLNDGEILGQQVADATQQEIANTLEKFEPHADIEVHYVFIPDRHEKVIALYAMPHLKHRPYSFDGRAFIANSPLPCLCHKAVTKINFWNTAIKHLNGTDYHVLNIPLKHWIQNEY